MQKTDARSLNDIIGGADIFLGVSAPGVLKPDMVAKMVETPIIFALANPEPEIRPEIAREAKPDAILASNTSSLSVTAIAAGCETPERLAGYHFFNPVPLLKVVEVVDGGDQGEVAVDDSGNGVAPGFR